MNIKEQLEKMLEITGTYDWEDNPDYRSMAQDISDLFKKWALEMVGKDDTIADYDDGGLNIPASLKFAGVGLVNDTKREIRQRIEESVK